MPPVDQTPQATIRYLTRLLAALARQAGGELRVKRRVLRQMDDEKEKIFLLEDTDSRKDEIVIRFDSKLPTIYPVEAETSQASSQTSRFRESVAAPPQESAAKSPQAALPFSDEQLARAEEKIRKLRIVNQLKRERPPASL